MLTRDESPRNTVRVLEQQLGELRAWAAASGYGAGAAAGEHDRPLLTSPATGISRASGAA